MLRSKEIKVDEHSTTVGSFTSNSRGGFFMSKPRCFYMALVIFFPLNFFLNA